MKKSFLAITKAKILHFGSEKVLANTKEPLKLSLARLYARCKFGVRSLAGLFSEQQNAKVIK